MRVTVSWKRESEAKTLLTLNLNEPIEFRSSWPGAAMAREKTSEASNKSQILTLPENT